MIFVISLVVDNLVASSWDAALSCQLGVDPVSPFEDIAGKKSELIEEGKIKEKAKRTYVR